MKMKLTIEVPIYNCKCVVFIDNDIEKLANTFIKKNKIDVIPLEEGAKVRGLAFQGNTTSVYYIFYALEDMNINTLSHEISHLVDYICGDRGITDTEARAYLTGHITEKVFDFILKKKISIHKLITRV